MGQGRKQPIIPIIILVLPDVLGKKKSPVKRNDNISAAQINHCNNFSQYTCCPKTRKFLILDGNQIIPVKQVVNNLFHKLLF